MIVKTGKLKLHTRERKQKRKRGAARAAQNKETENNNHRPTRGSHQRGQMLALGQGLYSTEG